MYKGSKCYHVDFSKTKIILLTPNFWKAAYIHSKFDFLDISFLLCHKIINCEYVLFILVVCKK